jgi:phage-related minor tail protein
MTEERKVQLGVAVDATEAKHGLGEIKREAQSMAQTVAQAGNQAGKAVDSIGDGGSASAQKVDAATKSMIQSIQRTTAAMEAGSKTTGKYYEVLAAQRGIDVNALKPYLTQLDAVADKHKQVGSTAGQTAQALRMVPAQVTDIVTSLASGQAPLTVLIQQGGQLKDMFGGIGPAARALGGYVAGLVNPFTLAAGAAAALGTAYFQGKKEADAYSQALIMSGNVAGTSASQLQGMAARIDDVTGTHRAAAAALAEMAGTGQIASRNLEEFTTVAIKMEDGVGIAVSKTVKNFQELGKSPVEASLKLNEQYRYLTAAVYEQIAALQAQGREDEAAALAQKTFSDEFGKRTKAVVENLGLLERGWKAVKKEAAEAIDEMLSIGRASTLTDQLKDVNSDIESYNPFSAFGPSIDTLKAQRDAILEAMRLEQRAATAAGEHAAIQQAAVAAIDAVTRANDKALSKQEQMNKALTMYRENIQKIRAANPNSDLIKPKLIQDTEKAIRESFADKGAIGKINSELEKQARLLAEGAGLTGDFAGDWERLNKAYASGKLSLSDLVERQSKLLAQQPAIKKHIEEEARVTGVLAAEWEEAARARAEYDKQYGEKLNTAVGIVNDYGRAIDENNRLTEYEISLLGKTESARNAAVDQYKIELGLKREIQRIEALGLEAADQKMMIERATAEAAKASGGAVRRAWLDDWKKINDDIGRSLTDALMDGGKSAGEYLKNYFKTLVLRPIIQAVMSPISGALATAFAPSGAMAAGTGSGGGTTNLLSAGKTLWDGFSSGFASFGNTASQLAQYGYTSLAGGTASVSTGMAGTGWVSAEGGAGYVGSGMSAAGSAAGMAAGVAGGIYGGRMISGGYSLNGGSGNAAVNTGVAIGAVVGSIVPVLGTALGALVGGLLGGVANRAFGHGPKKTQAFGIEGDFTADDFTGRSFSDWKRDGGWFTSDKRGTDYSALDSGIGDRFGAGMEAVKLQTKDFAESLGLSVDAIDGYSKHIRLTLTQDEAENQRLITELFGTIGEELANKVGDFSQFARAGEMASATMERLSVSLTTSNHWLSMLRQRLFQISMAGGDAASKLSDAFGGLENLTNASAAFYQTYYSDGERAARSAEDMAKALSDVNLSMPKTKAQLRDMAASLDLNTESGHAAYAVLLSIAPEFANVADATSRLAKETAAKLVATFTGDGQLVPALNTAALGIDALTTNLGNTSEAVGYISRLFLDAESGLISFSAVVDQTGPTLTGAQRAGMLLNDQIDALRLTAQGGAIDFEGLGAAMDGVSTETFVETIVLVFENLADRIRGVIGDIAGERGAVREAALQIVNPTVMSKAAISREIAGISTALPSNTTLVSALDQLRRADVGYAAAGGNLGQQKMMLGDYQAQLKARQQEILNLEAAKRDQEGWIVRLQADLVDLSDNQNSGEKWRLIEQDQANLVVAANNIVNINKAIATAQQGVQSLTGTVSVQQQAVAQAQAQAATQKALQDAAVERAKQAQLAYASALQNFTLDASKSVSKLGRLREETVKYYEAQKQLADLMQNSAAGLRQTVADYKYSQLTPQQQLQNLQTQFSTAYAMALSTDGEALAGYGDKLNNLLNPMLEKALEVYGSGSGYEVFASTVIARAESIAGRLETLTPTNYAADSLALLGQIDTTLAALDASSRSAEKMIVDAIDASRDKTADGLQDVVAAVTGTTAPSEIIKSLYQSVLGRPADTSGLSTYTQMLTAGSSVDAIRAILMSSPEYARIKAVRGYASGGYHEGGLRLVGEKGPELEVTGPSRIFSAAQTRDILSGGGNAAMVAELRALRQEVADLRIEAQATAGYTSKTARQLERITDDGLAVRTEAGVPLQTEVV